MSDDKAFPHELAAALDGDGSTLDAYLEIRSGTEILADIKALTKYKTPLAIELRDSFAAAALQGWMASYSHDEVHPAEKQHSDALDCIAANSYAVADAMLRERERKAE